MADSMAQGAKEFGRGIFQGVTGVVMEVCVCTITRLIHGSGPIRVSQHHGDMVANKCS